MLPGIRRLSLRRPDAGKFYRNAPIAGDKPAPDQGSQCAKSQLIPASLSHYAGMATAPQSIRLPHHPRLKRQLPFAAERPSEEAYRPFPHLLFPETCRRVLERKRGVGHLLEMPPSFPLLERPQLHIPSPHTHVYRHQNSQTVPSVCDSAPSLSFPFLIFIRPVQNS